MNTAHCIWYKNAGTWLSSHIAFNQLAMNLSMKNHALLAKLFYKNDDLVLAVLKKLRSDDCQRSSLMKMIKKFEYISSFAEKSGRGNQEKKWSQYYKKSRAVMCEHVIHGKFPDL
ncbi:hypothetical protein CDAR_438091 [Caerostris darwini]|uniref:Uncharacterized protein n=1 Tax=Caerostris darwini TaxID=1538125 RepID=A0AAV4MFP0_9ARAC|nr:hypothetical protein CDAR_438091 [Caerostris darwini]